MHRISAIAAIGKTTRVLGKDNDLVWDIPADLERFRNMTREHPIIMGRKTWESLPAERRPLPKRTNIVVSRNADYDAPGAIVVTSVEDAIAKAKEAPGNDEIFIIGGSGIFKGALPHTDRLCLTLVDDKSEGDVHFPEYPEFTKVVEHESHPEHTPPFEYVTLERA
jgi:dihydrofolate reductase